MSDEQNLPRYDRLQSYTWNFDNAPDPVEINMPAVKGDWSFCGLAVDSPLGMPAGPLLNGRWILYYASLGFDVLTYKTVRSVARECFPLPNLQPVQTGQLKGNEPKLPAIDEMRGSWAVSFGMPSKSPDVWRADIEQTRKKLPAGKLLSVSVVGSVQPGWSLDDLANDYAQCARWAVESGADCVETNFSCPNVSTCDGQLFQVPGDSAVVCEKVREAVGKVPYIIKVGHVTERDQAAALLEAVGPFIDAIAMTNSVATTVQSPDGKLLFDGQQRGICGDASRTASINQTRLFAELVGVSSCGRVSRPAHTPDRRSPDLTTDGGAVGRPPHNEGRNIQLIGVGGASTAEHVRQYLDAGAEAVHIATAAMTDPLVARDIRQEFARSIAR